jgi:demethylmenaquinone methyltransferase/2-methoxy-6-polyprenyl-1,4-benzoquinol methylase
MEDQQRIRERKKQVREMFDGIARRYDLLNHLLSAGVDIYWRRRALAQVRQRPERMLDLATGTGDFAAAAVRLRPERIVGVDVALNMLRLGAGKLAAGRQHDPGIRLMGGDAEELPFRESCFDLVTAAFGVRNFGCIPAGLSEAWRVLRPGGEILVLDFSEPSAPLFRSLYRFYFNRVLPVVGGAVSGNRRAYAYLPQSVGVFPQGAAFLELLAGAGFVDTAATSLSLGISSIYQGVKPEKSAAAAGEKVD